VSFFLQLLVSGLALGFIYAVITMGFVLIYKCSRVFNIAHGGLVLIGGYLGWSTLVQLHFPLWLTFLVAIAIAAIIGYVIERFTLRPLIGQPLLAQIMVTIALLLLMRGVVCLVWAGDYFGYPYGLYGTESVGIGLVTLSSEYAAGFVLSVVVLIILLAIFRWTKQGLAMRATAEDEQVVQSVGIRITTVHILTWVIATIVAVIGGILLGSISGVNLAMADIGLKALVVALLGGLDSIGGCIVAGLIIGVLENVAAGYLDPLLPAGGGLSFVFPFIIMIVVLMFRPYGLFGLVRIERI